MKSYSTTHFITHLYSLNVDDEVHCCKMQNTVIIKHSSNNVVPPPYKQSYSCIPIRQWSVAFPGACVARGSKCFGTQELGVAVSVCLCHAKCMGWRQRMGYGAYRLVPNRLRGCLHASNWKVLLFVINMSHDETLLPAPCVILNINRCVNACVRVDQLTCCG